MTSLFRVDHLETGMAVQKLYNINGDPDEFCKMFSMVGIAPVVGQNVLEFSRLHAGDIIVTNDSAYVMLVNWKKGELPDTRPLFTVFGDYSAHKEAAELPESLGEERSE